MKRKCHTKKIFNFLVAILMNLVMITGLCVNGIPAIAAILNRGGDTGWQAVWGDGAYHNTYIKRLANVSGNDVYAYCMEPNKNTPPNGHNCPEKQGSVSDFAYRVLRYGFPYTIPYKNSNAIEQMRASFFATQVAFWAALGKFDINRLRVYKGGAGNATAHDDVMLKVIKNLYNKAKNGTEGQTPSLSFSSKNIKAQYDENAVDYDGNKGCYVSDYMKINAKNIESSNDFSVTLTPAMPASTKIQLKNGKFVRQINVNKEFRIVIPKNVTQTSFKITAKATVKHKEAVILDGGGSYQDCSHCYDKTVATPVKDSCVVSWSKVSDTKPSSLKIVKVDENGKPLAGARFTVYDENSKQVSSWDRNETGSDGTLTYDLPAGKYSITEDAAPEGYQREYGPYDVVLTEGNTTEIKITNKKTPQPTPGEKTGTLKLSKKDADTSETLSGAKLLITGTTDSSFSRTVTSSSNGNEIQLPVGSYTVKEVSAPYGYELNSEEKSFTITADKTTIVSIEDEKSSEQPEQPEQPEEQPGELKFTKTDVDTGEILSGATMQIRGVDDTSFEKTFVSDSYGNSFELPVGTYTIREISAPYGYDINPEVQTFNIYDSSVTTVNIEDGKQQGSVRFTKKDISTGDGISGARIEVEGIDASNSSIDFMFMSDEDGNSFDLPVGNYTIKEIAAPYGYDINPEVQTFTVYSNSITRVSLSDKMKKGTVKFTKTDVDTGDILEGAQIRIRGLDDFNKSVDIKFTSSKNGNSYELPIGRYQITEISAPDGYNKKEESDVFTITENEITKANLTNEVKKGILDFTKTDIDSGKALDGATIEIKGIDRLNKRIDIKFTSSKNGNTFTLPIGKYTITELSAPKGYNMRKDSDTFIIEEGKTTKDNLTNEMKKGFVEFTKTDVDSGEVLDGAEIEIKGLDELNGFVDLKFTSSKNGNKFRLPIGNYTITEISAPEGYNKSIATRNFVIEEEKTTKTNLTNELKKGFVDFTKTDFNTGIVLAGAEIEIKGLDKLNSFVDIVFTSEKEGNRLLLPIGKYSLKEISAPDGYNINEEAGTFVIEEDKITKANLSDLMKRGFLDFTKTDISTGKILEGAHIEIKGTDELNSFIDYEFTSSKDGNSFTLPIGNYTITEISAPDGYNKKTESDVFTITENEITKANLTNEMKKGTVKFTKTDVSTGDVLDGAEIEIKGLNELNSFVDMVFTSSKNGNSFELPIGDYSITEITAPDGYNRTEETSSFTIEEGKITKANLTNEKKTGTVEFTKTDVSTGEVLEGAEIEIKGVDKLNSLVDIKFTSSKEGNKFTLPIGEYHITEISAPEGYNKTTETGKFTITENEITKANLTNEVKKGIVHFTKTDVSTGDVLDGAEIEIKGISELNKSVDIKFVSDKKGNEFTLPIGEYEFTEISAPDGYKVNKETGKFTIEEGKITKANLTNEKKTGTVEFTKTDVSTGEVLEGAEIFIRGIDNFNKDILITFTSSKKGNKFTLPIGEYEFTEITAPDGYSINEETGRFTITEDGITKANLKDKKITKEEEKKGTITIAKTGDKNNITAIVLAFSVAVVVLVSISIKKKHS